MSSIIKKYVNFGKWYEVSGHDELWEDIDFTRPENFCQFGSAQEYYGKTIEYVLGSFPYDGSWKEKHEWYEQLFMLDRYFYKNVLPKTTGHAKFSANGWGARAVVAGGVGEPVNKEYIKFFGGPHNPNNDILSSNVLNSDKLQGSSLAFGDENTIEFFMKRGNNDYVNTTTKECILDIYNNIPFNTVGHRRLCVFIETEVSFVVNIYLTVRLYVDGAFVQFRFQNYSLTDNFWHFYTITIKNNGLGNIDFVFYIDSVKVAAGTQASLFGLSLVELGLTGSIGAFQSATTLDEGVLGPFFGKLEADLDEVRFFKTIRTQEEIQTYYRSNIFGGTNIDEENSGLGFYFKFNEGVFGDSAADSIVLDYSGRKTNGFWYGYTANSRSEDSAFELSGACDKEEGELILNINDPRVVSVYDNYVKVGQYYDINNKNSVKSSFPVALVSAIDNDDFSAFCQIIGAFFDEMLLLQTNIPKNLIGKYEFTGLIDSNIHYRYLNSYGIKFGELFADAEWKEVLLGVNSSNSMENTVENVKKIILSNITNEAVSLLKSKGTTNGLKKALRCFGIAEDLISLKKYYSAEEVEDCKIIHTPKFFRKRYADFTKPENSECVVSNVIGVTLPGDRHYLRIPIDGTFKHVAHCFYCDLIVSNFEQSDTETSIFGMLQVNEDDETVVGLTLDIHATVKKSMSVAGAAEIKVEVPGIGYVGNTLVDVPVADFFDGGRWIVCVQVFSGQMEYANWVSAISDYSAKISIFKFVDNVCSLAYTDTQDGFADIDVAAWFSTAKRFFVGAYRNDMVGAVQMKSCCKVGDFRYYNKYMTDDEIIRMAEEPGVLSLSDFVQEDYVTLNSVQDSLLFRWSFDNVNEVVADGAFYKTSYIADLADGNDVGDTTTSIGEALSFRYPCTGYMLEGGLDDFFTDEYIVGYFEEQTENNFDGRGLTNFRNYDFEKFYKNKSFGVELYSLEKSFSAVIDSSVFESFSDKNQYFNLFLDGVQRYKEEYDVLAYARQLYFRKIKNGYLDFDRFYNYYKWIDGVVSEFLSQFVSMKRHSNNKIINTIEHHSLERTKASYKRGFDNYIGQSNNIQSSPINTQEIVAGIYLFNEQNSLFLYNGTNKKVQHGHVCKTDPQLKIDFVGNYFHNYDMINTCGRYENNKFNCLFENYSKVYAIPNQSAPRVFFDREFSVFLYNYCYSNFVPESARARGESVIINRFSAPGDIMTSSRRCDISALEKSVYNNLNFRNLPARDVLTIQWMVGQ